MSIWMVVEDEPDLYDMVLAMYEVIGVEGLAFPDGEEALEWLEDVNQGFYQANEMPELALLDVRLPGQISGPDVSAYLRQSPATQNMVVILMTAYQLSPHEEQRVINQAGADLLLYKPLPPLDKLRQLFHDLISARRP